MNFTQIIRLLLKMLPATRGYSLHEGDAPDTLAISDDSEPFSSHEPRQLLELAPLPEP